MPALEHESIASSRHMNKAMPKVRIGYADKRNDSINGKTRAMRSSFIMLCAGPVVPRV